MLTEKQNSNHKNKKHEKKSEINALDALFKQSEITQQDIMGIGNRNETETSLREILKENNKNIKAWYCLGLINGFYVDSYKRQSEAINCFNEGSKLLYGILSFV